MAELQRNEIVVLDQENSKPSFFRVYLDCLRRPSDHHLYHARDSFDRMSLAWKWVIVVLTVVLLFGSPIQFLFTTKEADIVFDVLYILALVVFILDMILNVLVDPAYLGFSLFHRNRIQPFDQPKLPTRGIGSFKMWCDLVSAATLFYDISYTNPSQYSEEIVELTLDQYGLPMNLDDFNPSYPVEFRTLDSLILVCKAARVARLIPSTKVVEISSQVNFYWYVDALNPFRYYEKLQKNREAAEKEMLGPSKGAGLIKRATWGGVEIAALAKVKALADERMKKEKQLGFFSRTLEKLKRGFRSVGFLPDTNVELKRHIAATKIQRAWRRRLARPIDTRSVDGLELVSEDGDGVWRGRGSGTSTVERAFKKRNMLGTYYRQNVNNIRKNDGRLESRKIFGSNHQTSTRADSQVGTAMAEVTGQWVASIILMGLILTILFTYNERDATRPSTMVVLHGQIVRSPSVVAVEKALDVSRASAIPSLYEFKGDINTIGALSFQFDQGFDTKNLREREKLRIIVENPSGKIEGVFENRQEIEEQALVELLMTIFVLVVWFLGVAAFAGPVMTLVITPIERMVRLLGMLMVDPLGYQSNSRFKKFLFEEDTLVKKSQWTKEVLKGMETSFLMSTILRIGSLMKVGFGSAGVEIIRNNLQKGQNKNMLILNSQGSIVSCIFLFCDIRQFTDATECLQEEVFVFTNRIAAVVHSICHSYGGSANKNVGDAFLVSWLLEDDSGTGTRFSSRSSQALIAKHNQADKALLSVVKICVALHYDNYYVETMSDNARNNLLNKLKNRPGPVVQMGFGLHGGKAVQGALGSERKIDATYVSEAVERAEFLESSTKQYGLKMLMSDTFHRLLHSSNRRRCRKIDRIMFVNGEDDDHEETSYDQGDIMELYTYDMDIDALWRTKKTSYIDGLELSTVENEQARHNSEHTGRAPVKGRGRRLSVRGHAFNRESRDSSGIDELRSGSIPFPNDVQGTAATAKVAAECSGSTNDMKEDTTKPAELILPTGPALYSQNIWLQEDMRRIRQPFTSIVFQTFNSGLQKYYEKDWAGARQHFEAILERFEDGPSLYFLKHMKKFNWKPPPDFQPLGTA